MTYFIFLLMKTNAYMQLPLWVWGLRNLDEVQAYMREMGRQYLANSENQSDGGVISCAEARFTDKLSTRMIICLRVKLVLGDVCLTIKYYTDMSE